MSRRTLRGGGSTGTPLASAVATTPAGGLSSTDVQSALNELDTEKANVATTPTKAQAIGYAIVFGGN